jgi:hypothetical protein
LQILFSIPVLFTNIYNTQITHHTLHIVYRLAELKKGTEVIGFEKVINTKNRCKQPIQRVNTDEKNHSKYSNLRLKNTEDIETKGLEGVFEMGRENVYTRVALDKMMVPCAMLQTKLSLLLCFLEEKLHHSLVWCVQIKLTGGNFLT